MRNQRGITLIALVITIIVLLILAGVSIAMLTGNNGILTKSTEAKTNTTKGEVADKINLTINAEYANILTDKAMSGDAAAIAKANGINTTDFLITVNSITDETVLEIKPSTTGAYKDYASDTNLVGSITYDATDGYTLDKAEVK